MLLLFRVAALAAELRPLLHTGTAVHADPVDPALRITGVVGVDRDEAVFTVATVATLEEALPEPLRLPGLDPERLYRVRVRDEIGSPQAGWIIPPWLSAGEARLPGRVLGEVGLQLPVLWPFQALVLHLIAEEARPA